MEQWMKDRIDKCKDALGKTIRNATNDYIDGNVGHMSLSGIEDSTQCKGRFFARQDAGSSFVDLAYIDESVRHQDCGNSMASFSTEYFNIEQIAVLMIRTIDMLENGE